jgi:AcrR family transcriptional regulator
VTLPPGKRERLHRGRTVEQRRKERRALLLDTALELFASKGFASTSIDDLCRTSYVHYRYFDEEFGDRETLLVALYDELIGDIARSVLTEPTDAIDDEDEVRAVTRERISAFVHGVTDDERVARIVLLETGGPSGALVQHRRRAHRMFADYILDSAATDVRQGVVVEDRPFRWLALSFVGALNEVVTDWVLKLPAERRRIEEIIDAMLTIFMTARAGLRSNPG